MVDHDSLSSTINQWVGNGVSAAAIVTTLMGFLPAFAAGVALLWYLIQIYESQTVQRYVRERRARKIVAMKARVLRLEARNQIPARGPAETGH